MPSSVRIPDAVGVVFEGEIDVALHRGEVVGAIAKAAGAGPDHDDDRDVDSGFGFDQGAERGRKAAQGQRRVQFDAVRASRLGGNAILDRSRADLQDHGFLESRG